MERALEEKVELFKKLRDVAVSMMTDCHEGLCADCPFVLGNNCVLEHLQTHNI